MARVVFATDGSPAAALGGELIAGIPWPAGTTVWVVSVVPVLRDALAAAWAPLAGTDVQEMEAGEVAMATAAARAAADGLRAAGLRAEACVERGETATVIGDLARREAADLIVVGSRGRSALVGTLLGSVSAALTHEAPCPVLVARTAQLEHVLVADDGGHGASLAVDYLRTRPWLLGAAVRVIGVVGATAAASETFDLPIDARAAAVVDEDHEDVVEELRIRLGYSASGLRAEGRRADVVLEEGRPGPAILDAAERWPADLIVVGTRGRGIVESLVLGSVSQHVVTQAACSVLVVRPMIPPSLAALSHPDEAAAGS